MKKYILCESPSKYILKEANEIKNWTQILDPLILQDNREFDEKYGGTSDKIIKTISILDDDHPWTIVRAAELVRWVESGEYQRILDGCQGKVCPICGSEIAKDSTQCPICGNIFE